MTDQQSYLNSISQLLAVRYPNGAKAHIRTYGCQQNVSDGEKLKGFALQMGYTLTDSAQDADFVLYNTCAVRENAEDRVFGNLGALKHQKEKNPGMIIGVCGCMTQQEHIAQKIKKSYPHVDLIFGTHLLGHFPELVFDVLSDGKRVLDLSERETDIPEDLPVKREGSLKAWMPIMYGCNNFCTYCIVPHVRGRERSRDSAHIIKEFTELVNAGYKEITLLGQNVNSYGKDLEEDINFSDLLRMLNDVDGEFRLRFMTSHPKDASKKLFDTMADCDKVAKQLHLPFQSGSNEILDRMNRRYTAEHYRGLIAYAREKMPDITLSSDIIVGFPGETEEDFEKTRLLVEETGFDMLYTFLYSKRGGTPAAEYEDNTPHEVKQARFERLLKTQDEVVEPRQHAYQDRQMRILIDGYGKGEEYPYVGRTEGGLLVCCRGEDLQIGTFADMIIEKTSLRCLFARKVD